MRVAEIRISKRFDEHTMREVSKAVIVHVATTYKRKAQKIQLVDWLISDGSKPGGLQDWKIWEVNESESWDQTKPRGSYDVTNEALASA